MRKWKTSLLLAALTAALVPSGLAQTASDFEAPQVNRVANKLNCNCGCNMNMACLMPPYPCPVCRTAKSKIIAMQSEGKNDDQILAQFAKDEGKDIVVVPPGPMGVIGPYAALAIGLAFVILVIRRFMRPAPAVAVAGGGPAPAQPPLDQAMIDRIEKDLAKLD